MRIKRLKIENFRGIKLLDWTLPSDQPLVVLVGPGDSGKSTILDAIHYLLGDRWNIPFSDTDFYEVNVDEPISIKAILTDLPEAIRKENAFGLWLSGVDSNGVLYQDPEDIYTPALIARLSVDSSLEPKWTVERVDGQETILTVAQRRHFSTFKVDDRNDTQLRWSRTSALGRMSAQDGGEREALAAASRAAQTALASHESSSLADLARKIQDRANEIGGGRFQDIKPGLDTSRSSMGAGLALYESAVPLTSFGLGSRRLASFAIQQLAAGNRAVAVVDEVENGLEPHRSVRLLNYLLTSDEYSQVIVTTHSPVIVEQAQIENLATVRSVGGTVTVTSLGGSSEVLQRVRRSRPSTLLARRVIVAEGKTEYGLLLQMLDYWDEERITTGLSTSAGEGVAIQDGMGGSEVPLRALALAEIGYEVAGFMDNDVRDSDAAVNAAESGGVRIIRCDRGHNLESQICSELEADLLTSFVAVGVDRRSARQTVLDDINWTEVNDPVSTLEVSDWIAGGMTIEVARQRVVKAAVKRAWFKEVDGGRALGDWIVAHLNDPGLAGIVAKLDEAKTFVFQTSQTTPEPEAQDDGDGNG